MTNPVNLCGHRTSSWCGRACPSSSRLGRPRPRCARPRLRTVRPSRTFTSESRWRIG